MRNYSNFIGGDWAGAKSGRTFKNLNPADTREFCAEYSLSGQEDAAQAVAAARAAFPAWAATTPPARGRILSKTSQILETRKAELAEM
ncbi:MAG: alpha-ketoglutaric semialdehyde dehydrogenase, partial [Verrucomicrobiota bacterium]